MSTWYGRFTTALAAAALLAFVPAARAGTMQVSFFTEGEFTGLAGDEVYSSTDGNPVGEPTRPGPGTAYLQESYLRVSTGSGGYARLRYQNLGLHKITLNSDNPGGLQSTTNLGMFDVSGLVDDTTGALDTAAFSFAGRGFTLRIYQLKPTVGEAMLEATVSGFLQAYDDGGTGTFGADQLRLRFVQTSVVIAPGAETVRYSLGQTDAQYPDGVVRIQAGGFTSLDGRIAAVPLPGVAWAGIALFSLVGGKRLLCRHGASQHAADAGCSLPA